MIMTEKQLPIWWLDIDGVINAFPKRQKTYNLSWNGANCPVPDEEDGIVRVFPITWRTEVVDFINGIHRDGLAEIRWLTTWGNYARTHFAPLVGLDDFPVIDYKPPASGAPENVVWLPTWWKLGVLRKTPDIEQRRFIFTDDDLGKESKAIIRRDIAGDEPLLLTPLASKGLEDHHLKRIRDYLEQSDRSFHA